jgi:hypothetical protein
MGLIVARDFGADGGIYHGRITAVDMSGRRTYYHVTYDDGDEEDFDFEESSNGSIPMLCLRCALRDL